MSAHTSSSLHVWSRFEAIRKDGTILKLRIQDIPSSLFDRVMDFNTKYFTSSEHIQKSTGITKNSTALEEYKEVIKIFASAWNIVICCEDNDSETIDEIIGVSSISLHTGDLPLDGIEFQTQEMQKLFDVFVKLGEIYKPTYDTYHEGRGITVHPDYRGLGIATEFVKVRRMMINAEKVPMTCAWMTSYGSQKAAQKDNWETAFEITSEEFGTRFGVVFEDAPLTFKFMFATNST